MPDAPAVAGDTRVRRKVLAMTMALAAITYLDRVAIGVTRPYIARDAAGAADRPHIAH